MSIENPSERLERTEAYLKQRLSNYKDIMPVKGNNGVTLLEIYGEWMDYLVKENIKQRSTLLQKWQRFLLERNTDAVADLLIGFFEAKRRYGRDMERGEDKRDWFTLCNNYCKKNGWYEEENLLHSFFSSYSGAERRIYRKVEKGKVLADISKSILQIMDLTKSEMIKKEEEKKRKAEEKARKEAEKQRRREEKEKEKRREKKEINEEYIATIPDSIDEGALNHYGGKSRDIVKDGDVVLNPIYEHIPTDEPSVPEEEMNEQGKTENSKKKEVRKIKKSVKKSGPIQLEIPFED